MEKFSTGTYSFTIVNGFKYVILEPDGNGLLYIDVDDGKSKINDNLKRTGIRIRDDESFIIMKNQYNRLQ